MEIDIGLAGIIMLSHWSMFLVGIFVGMVLTIMAVSLGILLTSIIKKKKDKKKK